MFVEQSDGFGHLAIAHVAVAINEEEILPGLALAGAGLDFGHVDAEAAKGGEGTMQGAHLVHQADHQTGPVAAGGRSALAAQHEETRGVRGVVLNVVFQHAHVVFFGGQLARDRRGIFFLRRQFRRARVR